MDVEAAIASIDREVYTQTKRHLSDLQQVVITKVWQGKKYIEIADEYGCTEGHAKDTGFLLWKLLSKAWGKKITKSNFRSITTLHLQSSNNLKFNLTSTEIKAIDSAVTEQSNFIGRQRAIADLQNLIAQNHKIILLRGEGGIGKTSLAQQFLASHNFELTLEVLMAKETENIVSAASVVEEWLKRDLNEDAGKEFGVTLARLKRCLSQKHIAILIDNLEPALDKDGKLLNRYRDYLELLRILADPNVKSTTIITSRDRLCEAEINLEHYRLSGLDLTAWTQYFTARKIDSQTKILTQIHYTYGGNAKAMGIVGGIIREDYDGNIQLYWQENSQDPLVETDLKNLVSSQFDRLQELDLKAYALLCRLGCYRYQDIPRISQSGIFCLLWDVPNNQKRRVIKSLQNRSLIEFAQSKYWLHPMVQIESKLRLQRSPQWQQANREVAAYLTQKIDKINNIQQGLTALEAYYHWVAISDYEAAAKVILYGRENQWGQFLTLGTTLCRLGIIQPLLTAIERIVAQVGQDRYRSELNNILGDLYWTTGKVHQAIACQEKTIITSQNCLKLIPPLPEHQHDLYYWRMLEVDSLLSLGLYNIDLWELSAAINLFQQVINLAHNTKHHSWSEKASLALALVNSYQITSKVPKLVTHLYHSIVKLEDETYNTGRFAYFMQILGQIFFNYQQIEPAKVMWQKAIAFSRSSHYSQTEAKSLVGLATVERYNHNYPQANTYYQQAAELLEQIGAKCDLAAAYFQWGISLQVNQQQSTARQYFNRASELYQSIPAPKQVQRIKKLMADNS